jgi:hypothetical protein
MVNDDSLTKALGLWTHSAQRFESYVTTDGQSASLSWNKAPIWSLRPDLYYCPSVAGLLMWGALSDERTGLSPTIAAGSSQRSHSRVRAPWDSRPYFTVSDLRLPISSPLTTRSDPASTRVLPLITSGEPNRGHHLEQLVVILPVSRECVFVNIRCRGNLCQSLATLWPLPAYPLQRESVFIEPLLSNWPPFWLRLHYSGFQTELTDPLPSNGHVRPDCGVDLVVSSTPSYSEVSANKSQPGVQESWLRIFAVFLSSH